MCSVLKTVNTELAELSRGQHEEIILMIGRLTKALYIAAAVLASLVLLMAGCIFFAITILLSR